MFQKLQQHLREDKIRFSIVDEIPNTIAFGIRTDIGSYQCFAEIREEEKIFLFYTIIGLVIPEPKRNDTALLLSKVNYGLMLGNFEMDFNDGEIRYKVSMPYNDGITDDSIRLVISAAISTTDKYLKHIVNLATNDNLNIIDLMDKIDNDS